MLHENEIKFLGEMFVVLLETIMVLYIIVKFFELAFSKFEDVKLDTNYEHRQSKNILWNIERNEAYNSMQTPRRFSKKNAIELPSKPLIWSREYKQTPNCMKISNRMGHVLLEVQYSDSQARLSGGPLDSEYSLQHIVFKWRPRNVKNWENITNKKEFVLELQAIHYKNEFLTRAKRNEDVTLNNTEKSPVLIINYVYKISEEDNFALELITSRFGMIEERVRGCYLNPFPVSWILPKFSEYYYIQQEPQPYLPFAQGVQWILSPTQPTMSKQQMDAFKKILNQNCTMALNKSYKQINKKEVFFCSEIEEEPQALL